MSWLVGFISNQTEFPAPEKLGCSGSINKVHKEKGSWTHILG